MCAPAAVLHFLAPKSVNSLESQPRTNPTHPSQSLRLYPQSHHAFAHRLRGTGEGFSPNVLTLKRVPIQPSTLEPVNVASSISLFSCGCALSKTGFRASLFESAGCALFCKNTRSGGPLRFNVPAFQRSNRAHLGGSKPAESQGFRFCLASLFPYVLTSSQSWNIFASRASSPVRPLP